MVGAVELPNQPLLTEASVKPNVMMLFDTSGSMNRFEYGGYDASVNYGTCADGLALLPNQLFDARNRDYRDDFVTPVFNAAATDSGMGYFTYDGTNYEWGTSGEGTLYPTACFSADPITVTWGEFQDLFESGFFDTYVGTVSGLFEASALDSLSSAMDSYLDGSPNNVPDDAVVMVVESPDYLGSYWASRATRVESGPANFWNYYFSNADQTGPDLTWGNRGRKFGVGSRLQISQDAGEKLLMGLSDVRLGLAAFERVNEEDETAEVGGALILSGIEDIDADIGSGVRQRDQLLNSLADLRLGGDTPISEALSDIGRYFISGHENEEITIHADTVDAQAVLASEVFSTLPAYAEGVVAPADEIPAKEIIQGYCQENYIIALTDGIPNETGLISPLLMGGSEVGSHVGYDADGIDNSIEYRVYDDGSTGPLRALNVLDDITLALNDSNLRPSPDDPVGLTNINNIKTYFIGGFDSSVAEDELLMRAAANGVRPDEDGSVRQANNVDELVESLNSIFTDIEGEKTSLTTVAFNSGAVSSDSLLFQATFNYQGSQWWGDLAAYPYVNPDDNDGNLFADTPSWTVAAQLDARVADPALGPSNRTIITAGSVTVGMETRKDGVPFRFLNFAQFSDEMRDDLDGAGGDPILTAKVIAYLRGQAFEEFRDRTSGASGLLGDIVNSSPIEVGEPEIRYPNYNANSKFGDSSPDGNYSYFASTYANRKSVIYVGANDGMLHAFSGSGDDAGKELFAYIPSQLANGDSETEGLFYLTSPSYQHRFYVDGTLTASDVFIDAEYPVQADSRNWRTIVVGALGNGGKGLFALDVTNPATFSEGNADDMLLWEFDGNNGGSGDSDMGHVFGEAKVVMMNNGKFAVITGNGVNSDGGLAKLFILFIEEGVDGEWSVGDYIELDTQAGDGNGLFAPVLADTDGDRVVDWAYAGDLKGNLWAFDLRAANASGWKVAHGTLADPEPLFSAVNNDGESQAITTTPLVVINKETPFTDNLPNLVVLFGTGKMLEFGDYATTKTESFYAVWDRGDGAITRSDLQARTLETPEGSSGRKVSGDAIVWYNEVSDSGDYGWYMDLLPESGERVIADPAILLGTIFFTSVIPSSDVCDAGGMGYLNSIGVDGLATTNPIYDYNGDGVINDEDQGYVSQPVDEAMPSGSAFIGAPDDVDQPCPKNNGQYQAFSTSNGEVSYRWVCPDAASGLGRVAWQELFGN
ncbi:pilus assembly protein [Halioxenophilus sp. WMMB6]|uniref:pilus assembly protein n=1 Tax=Halioxenophilus sp. WMMB6 TaxID=3073815 RepID=UPI00295E7898|nr:PilC/PilY family type IV pilus protein [Halioxenophilus sp. WMMB6]